MENRGIIEVVNNLIDHISFNYDIELSPKEAKDVLDSGKLELYGKEYDLSDIIKDIATEYSHDLMKQIERKFKKSWHKFKKIIVVGGLSYYIDDSVYPHLNSIEKGEFYNAVGFLKYGTDKISQEKNKKPRVARRKISTI